MLVFRGFIQIARRRLSRCRRGRAETNFATSEPLRSRCGPRIKKAPRVIVDSHTDPRVGMGMGATASGPTGAKDEYVVTYCRVRVCPPPVPLPRHRARRRGHRRRVSRARHDATLSTALTSPTSSTRHRRTETGGSRSSTPPRMPSSACTATRRWCPTASTPIPSPSRYHKTEPPSGAGASRRSSPRTAAPRRRRSSPRSTKDKTNTTKDVGRRFL